MRLAHTLRRILVAARFSKRFRRLLVLSRSQQGFRFLVVIAGDDDHGHHKDRCHRDDCKSRSRHLYPALFGLRLRGSPSLGLLVLCLRDPLRLPELLPRPPAHRGLLPAVLVCVQFLKHCRCGVIVGCAIILPCCLHPQACLDILVLGILRHLRRSRMVERLNLCVGAGKGLRCRHANLADACLVPAPCRGVLRVQLSGQAADSRLIALLQRAGGEL